MSKNVIAVVDDLFFASKIRGAAEQTGIPVSFARKIDGLIESALQNQPAVIIVDLNSQKIDPIELARQLKADERLRDIPLVGFFSHVQTELQQRAQDAGFDQVMPRSLFTRNLALILQGTL
jgi:CheY-like chemotaxis protein